MWITIKLKIKRLIRFCKRGGLQYLTLRGGLDAVKWRIENALGSRDGKRVFWIGAFSPIHANVGDHAQTLAVQQFLDHKYNDHSIVRIYRDDISEKRLLWVADEAKEGDLILLHSSGDFGSMHDSPGHHPGRLSYPEVRRRLVGINPAAPIVNLPTTMYYEENERGRACLAKDQAVFNDAKFTVLCREQVSLDTAQKNLDCKSLFFPDFVFYLKPKRVNLPRKGVMVILRNDKEAATSNEQKQQVVEMMENLYQDVKVKDVMHESFTVPDFILEPYMDRVMEQFQERELIVTDKMHGMITAVITQTPCIALGGGIPHKISAYQSFLEGAVEFVKDVSEIEEAAARVRRREYKPVDLSSYYEGFRNDVVDCA